MASDELSKKLQRRQEINEGNLEPDSCGDDKVFNPYLELKQISRKQVQEYMDFYKKYNTTGKGLGIDELKIMMEKLGAPQTHLALKEMIRDSDLNGDGLIDLREFLNILRRAMDGELSEDTGLFSLYTGMEEIDVDKEGVGGAAHFFETKMVEHIHSDKLANEIRDEQEERKRNAEEARKRKQEFQGKAQMFQQMEAT